MPVVIGKLFIAAIVTAVAVAIVVADVRRRY
jgi:hypothetical protein